MKKKKKEKIKIFAQDTGIFLDNFVATNCIDKKKILRFIKKQFKKDFYEQFDRIVLQKYLEVDERSAATFIDHETNAVILIVIPGNIENNWDFLDSLNHEIAHAVHYLSIKKGFEGETEAKAYLHEYLFREIRRKFYK